jgi:prepilin-type N-terminal cleavage/methylation domain-containing protein
MRASQQSGFTLIELSIVLIIIGLIVSGVLAGQSLIESAKLRAVANEINQFKTAYNAFQLKYDALPGDMINAQLYWGVVTNNGNNNKQINGNTTESIYAWQHLSLAGLIPGEYTGVYVAAGSAMVGPIFPRSAFDKVYGYEFFYSAKVGWAGTGAADSFNYLRFGPILTAPPHRVGGLALTPTQAMTLDDKIDDGLPGLGYMYVRGGTGDCNTTWVTDTAIYNLSSPDVPGCYAEFIFSR